MEVDLKYLDELDEWVNTAPLFNMPAPESREFANGMRQVIDLARKQLIQQEVNTQ